jgi:hypothetical protein
LIKNERQKFESQMFTYPKKLNTTGAPSSPKKVAEKASIRPVTQGVLYQKRRPIQNSSPGFIELRN